MSNSTVSGVIFTNAGQIRALSLADATSKLPVKLHTIVTAIVPGQTVFIQDNTGGTFLTAITPDLGKVVPGDVLEIEGTTFPGLFVPGVLTTSFKVTGHEPLPAAKAVSFDDLLSSRWHYQRVEVQGIVRSIMRDTVRDRFILTIAMGSRKLEVQVIKPGNTNLPPLVDANVQIAGLAAGYINDRRQLISPHLFVNNIKDIRIKIPPRSDPFDIPSINLTELLNFDPKGISGHRVRVQGVVTHQQFGEAIFLRDADRGVMVQTVQNAVVHPGDVVEAVGFPAMGSFSAFLENAEFHIIGNESSPMPVATTIAETLQGMNDANLISVEAQLLEMLETPTESILVLQASETAFRARLPRTTLTLRNGSHLRLTGVCRVEAPNFSGTGFRVRASTVELLLRSPEDIVAISAPSWWTSQRLSIAASILLGLGLAALIWIVMLRRRVVAQSEIIREKVQREAVLEERHRMAREMHDTLAQSFSGLGFQLEGISVRLPAEAAEARTQLETARQMVRHGQEDFRRTLLDLRAEELERGTLSEALSELARHITTGTSIELRCNLQSAPYGLPDAVEGNLLRIGQECLTNAVRHGHPKSIQLSLTYQQKLVKLQISDDGVGFDTEQLKQVTEGHFGWRGIRERAEQIQAKAELISKPGHGTTVTIIVPIKL